MISRRSGPVFTTMMLLCATGAHAQNWSQPVTFPTDRIFYAAAFDALHGQLVMFGGANAFSGLGMNDTWVFDGTTWTQKSPPTNPPARWASAMVYDSVHGQIIMFGGYGESAVNAATGQINSDAAGLADTWTWDGTNWTQQSPSVSPPARYLHSLAFDSTRGRAVLFGGSNSSPNNFRLNTETPLGDTWLWDGSNWTQPAPAPSPSARSQAAMTFDAANQQVVLFGGVGGTVNFPNSETWVWDGTNWTRKNPATSPAARCAPGMAFDTSAQKVSLYGGTQVSSLNAILVGGGGTSARDSDQWQWDGTTWTKLTPNPSPGERAGIQLVYDTQHQQAVTFAGVSTLGTVKSDTWVWNGGTWSQPASTLHPDLRYQAAVVYDPVHQNVVVFGGGGTRPLSDTWIWDGAAWTQRTPSTVPDAGQAVGVYDAARQVVTIVSMSTMNLWTWDGTNWTNKGATGPSQRDDFGMSYDAQHQQVVLFGGSFGNLMNDTWLWNGASWSQAAPAHNPSARAGASMSYDATNHQTVLFGGEAGSPQAAVNETWLWDGTDWTQKSPGISPPARGYAGMSYDSGSSQTILFGGSAQGVLAANALGDTWSWDGSAWSAQSPAASPSARKGNSMTYDALHQATFAFGGFDAHSQGLEDTWVFASRSKTTLTITVPPGIQYAIDGFPFTGTQTMSLPQGSYSLTMVSPQSTGVGSQAVFVSWSDSGTLSHQLNLTTPTLNVIGTFKTQYLLTSTANPPDEGIVTQSGSGFYDAGTLATLIALANPGFAFTGWSGACTGSTPLCFVTMNAPVSVTGTFARAMFQVTINTPPGVSYTLGGFPFTGSVSIPLPAGSYSLSVNSPMSTGAGSQSVFISWSDFGAQTHNIVVTTAPIVVTGTFKTQYQLTTAPSPNNEGSVTQTAGPFYDAGSTAVAVAVPKPGFEFEYWSGGCTGSSGICLVTMNSPQSAVANFSLPLDWVQLFPPNHPSTREGASMAYDIANKQTVLFGGIDETSRSNDSDTWIWDGVNWTQKFPALHPSARNGHNMAYDAARHQVVLFGGEGDNFDLLGDTWLWDGADWSLSPVSGPPSSAGVQSMAYDAAHQQIVQYGGISGTLQNPIIEFGTWVWNGTTWTKIGADTPQIQIGPLAYDAARQRIVMESNGTWTWDGAQWAQASASDAFADEQGDTIAFDALHQQTIGIGTNQASIATSIWDGANWIQRFPSQSPPGHSSPIMAYDANAQNVVLFGNQNAETWVWIAPVVNLVPQATTVAKDGAGNYLVTVTLKNQGNIPVSLLFVSSATLGGAANTGFTTPQFIGPINAGATGSFTAKFPIAAFPIFPKPTPAVSFSGSYTSGPVSGASWSINVRSVTLP